MKTNKGKKETSSTVPRGKLREHSARQFGRASQGHRAGGRPITDGALFLTATERFPEQARMPRQISTSHVTTATASGIAIARRTGVRSAMCVHEHLEPHHSVFHSAARDSNLSPLRLPCILHSQQLLRLAPFEQAAGRCNSTSSLLAYRLFPSPRFHLSLHSHRTPHDTRLPLLYRTA